MIKKVISFDKRYDTCICDKQNKNKGFCYRKVDVILTDSNSRFIPKHAGKCLNFEREGIPQHIKVEYFSIFYLTPGTVD